MKSASILTRIRLSVPRFDPATKVWTTLPPLPTARSYVGLVPLGGFLYAVGGMNSFGDRIRTVERFNMKGMKWEAVSDMKSARSAPGLTVLGKKIYVVGGSATIKIAGKYSDHGKCVRLRSTERYDPATGAWEILADMAVPRSAFGIAGAARCWPYLSSSITRIEVKWQVEFEGSLNIRSEPKCDAKIVGMMTFGDTFYGSDGEVDGWVKLLNGNWILKESRKGNGALIKQCLNEDSINI